MELGQGTHYTLKCNQGHCIRRERPEEAWHKAPPVPSPPTLTPHSYGSVLPAPELSLAVVQRTAHRIGHKTLLHNVRRVRSDPEALCRDTASPEINCRGGQRGVLFEVARQDVVRAPPEEEKGTEEDGCPKTTV